jgi:subtilisin family serine protease
MSKKTATLLIGFVIFMLIATLSLLVLSQPKAYAESPTSSSANPNDSFTPTVWKPAWVDQDNNGIADSLGEEIADRIANGAAQDYVNVTVMLKAAPTTQDAADFISFDGYLTTSPWTEATYGFGGMIPYDKIANFTQQCPNVLLIEKEAVGKATVAYAAQQVGARTYVWNTLGLQGDPDASTAIVDTGIDGSHVDFSLGYGDQDFSKKIVGWNDQIGFTTFPVDDNGHGSHVAGLAAGDGFFSVDASGNAVTTWGANLGSVSSSGLYLVSGMMVNKTGTITINVTWARTGTASLSGLALYYGGKTLSTGSWTQVASVSTPSQNNFYSLTYNVASIPSGGYDMYQVVMSLTRGTGDLYAAFNMSWPYTPPSDGFSAWTGIAPQSKLVGAKVLDSTGSGAQNQLISGINWIIANRMTYHITVASMSLGFDEEKSLVDAAVLNLVNSGVTVVVAAGNGGSGDNYVYTCGSVDEVITVAAMNQFDNIASYSSQGGPSRYTGKTTKPDITAPGGSFFGVPLFSVDSNHDDADGEFPEIQANDSAPMKGTSMATPVISGCAQIIIQAMGGYAKWNWTRSQALQPKMILLMTATETYPKLREIGTSPTLERGGKDAHEGYGRVNLDVAVDAVVRSYAVESVVTDTLGTPPTLTDISVLGQRLAWARNVQLISGGEYNFSLSIPAGADYDLYLYNSTGTTYGEPAIVVKSINATSGGTEQFWVTAPYTGTYYIVVKRATETTGSGTFTLASSSLGTANVTLNTVGLLSASNVVHYTQNGVSKMGSIVAGTFSEDVDIGTTLTIDNHIDVSATQRYITTDSTSFTIQSSAIFTVNYETQYYITVNSAHDVPTASQWVDQGSNFTTSVISPTEILIGDHQWVCTGHGVDGGLSQSGISYTFVNVQAAHTIVFNWKQQFWIQVNSAVFNWKQQFWIQVNSAVFNWKQQFWIQVNSAHDSPTASAWVDQGEDFVASVTSPTEITPNDHQLVCTGYSLDGGVSQSGTSYTFTHVQASHTVVFNWKEQFYLTVNSAYGSPSGGGWYDTGATANAVLSGGLVSGGAGVQYAFAGWSGDASGIDLMSNSIIMDSAKTATANWVTQYYLILSSDHGTVGYEGWYDSGTSAYAIVDPLTVVGTAGTQYVFTGWSGDASGAASTSNAIVMNAPKTAIANWKTQHYLDVSANFGSVSPSSGWYDAGSMVTIEAAAPSADSGERYVWNGWTGTGSGSYTDTDSQASVTMNGAVTEAASWTLQYYLNVTSLYGSPTPVSGWFDAGTSVTASINSPVAESIVTQHACTGWAGTGSIPASGTATSVLFIINQPSNITWNWEIQYLPTLLLIIMILAALTGSAIYVLLRRKQKRKSAGGAPEPASPSSPSAV